MTSLKRKRASTVTSTNIKKPKKSTTWISIPETPDDSLSESPPTPRLAIKEPRKFYLPSLSSSPDISEISPVPISVTVTPKVSKKPRARPPPGASDESLESPPKKPKQVPPLPPTKKSAYKPLSHSKAPSGKARDHESSDDLGLQDSVDSPPPPKRQPNKKTKK